MPFENNINLGFFHGQLKKMYENQNLTFRNTNSNIFKNLNQSKLAKSLSDPISWKALVNDYIYILKRIKPEVIIAPYPRLDHNQVHKLSTIALLEAIEIIGKRDGKLLLYTNHLGNHSAPIPIGI